MNLYIVGAGGFGRETLDAIRAISPSHAASVLFLDNSVVAHELDGIRVIRPDKADPGSFVVAVADPTARHRLASVLTALGHSAAQVVHPRAVVSAGATLSPGCVVLANAFVSTGAVLGWHTHVNYNATVGHDAVLGDFVTVLPGANVAGNVALESCVTVGSNACVLQGLRIGSGATVGAGAVVTRHLPDNVVVVGVPARPFRPVAQAFR
jgi:sugar O-acyltransferase (sialic acid O-acetyltransferase NeuD family)